MLTEIESKEVLRAYGVKTTSEYIAKTAKEAASHASKLGFPIVLKILSPDITHKSDIGGVITDVKTSEETIKAFERIMRSVKDKEPGADIQGIIVENQLPPGTEVIVGSILDNDFGPVVAFGSGGLFVEIFRDLSYGLSPLSKEEALSMISNTKAAKLLKGIRGQPPANLNSLADLIRRVSFLSFEQPIVEMDLNPVIASADECAVADARIRVRNRE